MKVRIKKLDPNAVVPKYAKPGDAGLDLTVVSKFLDEKKGQLIYGTGLAIEIPEGHVGFLFPRSSIYKTDLRLTNCVGVVDSGYRGEIKAVFDFSAVGLSLFEARRDRELKLYAKGDRTLQLLIMPYPMVELEEVEELSKTIRGSDGFGSSGA